MGHDGLVKVRTTVVGVLVAASLLCACGTNAPVVTHSTAPSTSTLTPSTTSVVPTTAAPPTTASSTSNPVPSGFEAARQQWVQGAAALSYQANTYLLQAASDLSTPTSVGSATAQNYQAAVQQLKMLASLPETGDTPAQIADAHSAIQALNAFFGTQGLYN